MRRRRFGKVKDIYFRSLLFSWGGGAFVCMAYYVPCLMRNTRTLRTNFNGKARPVRLNILLSTAFFKMTFKYIAAGKQGSLEQAGLKQGVMRCN
jgi:cbb3-type cytochrome oxidase subunit 1